MTRRDVEERMRQLAPLDAAQADVAWRLFISSEGDERASAAELLDLLLFQTLEKDYRRQILLAPPSPVACAGEYPVGTVLYPDMQPYGPFGLRESEWLRHVLIVGMTGTGKTHLVFHLLRVLHQHGKPVLLFDWKRNYRDLRQIPEFRDLRVFTVGRDVAPFHFNPLLPPPGVGAGEWLMKLVDVLRHAYFVGEGVEYLLRRSLDRVYETTGLHAGTTTTPPTWHQERELVQRQRLSGRMSLWQASALRVLESLCFRHGLGPVFNGPPWDHGHLLTVPVVLELDALADADKVFLTEALILWLYEYRKRRPVREEFVHALVIEEAHHILGAHAERKLGVETIMETCLRQIREFGEAVLVIDQEPSKLSQSIKANTATKITFALGTGHDLHEIVRCLNLTEEETRMLDLLHIGHAAVSVRGRFPGAIHVRFPPVPIRKGLVRDVDLAPRPQSP